MNTIESIVSCRTDLMNNQGHKLSIYGDFYTIYDKLGFKRALLGYRWEIKDKEGELIMSHGKKADISQALDYFDSHDVKVYCNENLDKGDLRIYKEMLRMRVIKNMKTYGNMGFHQLSDDINDDKAVLDCNRYRIAFSDGDTGQALTKDFNVKPVPGESVDLSVLRAFVYRNVKVDLPGDLNGMIKGIKRELKADYIGCYKVF